MALSRLDDAERVGPVGRADLLAAQGGQAGRGGVLQHQDPLGRVEVDAGEVDLLQPRAGDRHRVRHDVHGAGGDVGDPLRIGDRLVLDVVRVAEDGLGHRLDHVDVEALDLPGERVEEVEVVGVLVHPRDEVAAGADLRHERARVTCGGPDGLRLLAFGLQLAALAVRTVLPVRAVVAALSADGWPGAAAAAAAPSTSANVASTTGSARRQGPRGRRGRAFTGTPRADG